MRVARGDAVALTRELVRIDSRNPSLVPGGPGENAVARTLADVLTEWGFVVEVVEVAPGRPNVVARTGRAGTRSLMFNGHVDVVGVDGMVHEPWAADERDGRIYGRGSSDMKAGVASMCAAAIRATSDGLDGEIIVTAVVDEEFESIGTRGLLERGVRADAAIVTEPTRLAIMPAHLGFVWIDVTTHGHAAHGSRWEIGVDAIRHAGLVLAELDRMDAELLPTRSHPLLGRPSIHASTIEGGTGMSTYPDRCTIRIERRTIPGESPLQVQAELEAACARVATRRSNFRGDVTVTFSQLPSDVAVDAPIVLALGDALRGAGESVNVEGMSAWTDAALLNAAGVPAICFGPGDIALAHAAEEWVSTSEIERATNVLARLASSWCGGRGSAWRS
ncbi:MAG: acetylornithine deacetylase or succinyl-diaminopimelate desuccinylase [Gemmatimonadetes bacterium]|nr:acetylornithine deacetylase or succinyl-diaminopimelate desuccinylase [Gemmatimonadota bacterium]